MIPSKPGGEPRFLPVTEIISDNAFFDYEAKYAGKSREETPADIDADLTSDIQHRAVAVYRDLDCSGMARVDFILHEGCAPRGRGQYCAGFLRDEHHPSASKSGGDISHGVDQLAS